MTEGLSASQEDYLEAIYHIVNDKGAARPKDIALRLEVNNSSVTGALKALAAKELVNYAPYDIVTLTPAGEEIARDVVRRHEALKEFFIKVLSVDAEVAEVGACKMEHEVPRPILERFIQFVEYVEICPRGGTRFVEGFGYHCESGCNLDDCARCLAEAAHEVDERRAAADGGRIERLSLNRLEPGKRARIVEVTSKSPMMQRLAEMGLTTGALIEVERVDPHGDPIEVKLRGHHLALRATEAAGVLIEEL